jgi:hypothetical protein
MATSTVSFQGVLDSTGSCELYFTPPSNVAGKACYVDIKAFGLSWQTAPTNPQVYDTYLLYSSWPQIQSLSVEPYGAGPYYKSVTATAATNNTIAVTSDYLASQAASTVKIPVTVDTLNGSTNILAAAWNSDFAIGQYVVGSGIPTNSVITALDQATKKITISNAATATAAAVSANVYTSVVTMAQFDAKIVVGMKVSGTGIADGTTVTAIASSNVTLSSPPSVVGSSLAFYPTKVSYTNLTAGLDVGDVVSGTGITSGTKVTAIDTSAKTITLSDYVSSASTTLTFQQTLFVLPTTAGLSVGMTVSGVGIESGTQITSVDNASIVTLSRPITTATTASTYTFTMPVNQMTQKMQAPLASLSYGGLGNSQGAPVLTQLAQGPQSVTFNVIRLDRGAVPATASFLVLATLVDARSRSPPLC